jgi:hypothetical protein
MFLTILLPLEPLDRTLTKLNVLVELLVEPLGIGICTKLLLAHLRIFKLDLTFSCQRKSLSKFFSPLSLSQVLNIHSTGHNLGRQMHAENMVFEPLFARQWMQPLVHWANELVKDSFCLESLLALLLIDNPVEEVLSKWVELLITIRAPIWRVLWRPRWLSHLLLGKLQDILAMASLSILLHQLRLNTLAA